MCVVMSGHDKRSSSSHSSENAEKRCKTLSELVGIKGVSKTGLASVLQLLNDRGLLTDSLVRTPTHGQYRRGVQAAVEAHGLKTNTPYGTVIQEMDIPSVEMPRWHYINPFALIAHLCFINKYLYDLISAAVDRVGGPLRVLIYMDGINPGNPLRPDRARELEAIYWTFAELPNWFLRRKDSWFPFGLLRCNFVDSMTNQSSEFMTCIMKVFFTGGDSWINGICLQSQGRSRIVVAVFGGFLADEKALKEIFDITGQAGSAPCFTCLNVRNRWVAVDDTTTLKMWDPDRSKIVKATDTHIRCKVRRLREAAEHGGNVKRMQTLLGINYSPNGLLFCAALTAVLSPANNYIRDWMHTLVSNGVAGTHLALICQALVGVGCAMGVLQAYAKKFTLPRSRGKVTDLFFKDELMLSDHVRHFANDVLAMFPLLYAFLFEKAEPRGWLPRNIECFRALYAVLCILRRGAMSTTIHAHLTRLIHRHAVLFLELYGNISAKVKFHHLYDLPDDLLRIGALSCFVTERKNKDAKAVASSVSRHLERTATMSFLQNTFTHWRDNMEACLPSYLRRATDVTVPGADCTLSRSTEAILPCGDIFEGDVVLLNDGSIAKVVDFWHWGDDDVNDIHVRLERFTRNASGPLRFEHRIGDRFVVDSGVILEPCAWYPCSPSTIVVALPLFE